MKFNLKYFSYSVTFLAVWILSACGEGKSNINAKAIPNNDTMSNVVDNKVVAKMKIEVWSDIMCPFCYIGKRHYEQALKQFPDSDHVEIVWKSFQLDPDIPTSFDTKVNVYKYLAERKGISYEQSVAMHQNVVNMAKAAGLDYHFDKVVVANSFNAHRLIQLAKSKGKGDEIEERLFHAYFTEGKDCGDVKVLTELGLSIGLTSSEVQEAFSNDEYAYRVKQDIHEADSIRVSGVPFFVFDRKYAVSGAQPAEVFLSTLTKSFAEWRKNNPVAKLEVSNGPACTPDKECK
jgi:protein disulfide-isomerase